jgi:hypothetical protein
MMRVSDSTGRFLIAILLICICALCGAALFGIKTEKVMYDQETPFASVEKIDLPVDIKNAVASSEAIARRTKIAIDLSRGFFGMLVGGIVGLLVVLLIRRRGLVTIGMVESHTELSSGKNVFYILSCVLLFLTIWSVSLLATIKKIQPLPDIRFKMITKYLAVLSGVVSWALIGRKIQIGQTIPRILNWLLLGPFNYVRLKRFNSGQQKMLWVGFVLVICLVLFPPCSAFKSATGGKGIGDSEFVGFHFLLSDQYDILGDAPYVLAEIKRTAQVLLIAGVAICTFIGVLLFARKPAPTNRKTR